MEGIVPSLSAGSCVVAVAAKSGNSQLASRRLQQFAHAPLVIGHSRPMVLSLLTEGVGQPRNLRVPIRMLRLDRSTIELQMRSGSGRPMTGTTSTDCTPAGLYRANRHRLRPLILSAVTPIEHHAESQDPFAQAGSPSH